MWGRKKRDDKPPPVSPLKEALRQARIESAERSGIVLEMRNAEAARLDFIREIVAADVAARVDGGRVATRFPPEPNGYLHIGHAKSICLNFGVAADFAGACNLRFDDTNPVTEDTEYVDSIQDDVRWLGFDWQDRLYYASDYFERLYACALQLIRDGKAYVDSLSADDIEWAEEHASLPTGG